MAPSSRLFPLSNPLATVEQLRISSSQLDGIPAELESSIRYSGALLTQAAGILLRLPQDIVAQAIVTFTRFYVGPEGGSFRIHSAKDISAASVYLVSKLSFLPQSPRSILNVYAYLLSPSSPFWTPTTERTTPPEPSSYHVTEGQYLSGRNTLFANESLILRSLSYTTRTSTPHHLALTYLQTLSALPLNTTQTSSVLAVRTLAHLNAALLSPQLLYLTHQPTALAVAAIYLAARDEGVKLCGREWWEVFDVDREELGFLVVGLASLKGWVEQEGGRGRRLLDANDVEMELEAAR